MLLFAGHTVLGGWWLSRRDPDLLKERLTTASNVPRWDLLIARGNRISLLILLATAALDAGRFRWSAMPTLVQMIGTAAVVRHFLCLVVRFGESFPFGQSSDPERTGAYRSYRMVPIVSSGIRCTRSALLAPSERHWR